MSWTTVAPAGAMPSTNAIPSEFVDPDSGETIENAIGSTGSGVASGGAVNAGVGSGVAVGELVGKGVGSGDGVATATRPTAGASLASATDVIDTNRPSKRGDDQHERHADRHASPPRRPIRETTLSIDEPNELKTQRRKEGEREDEVRGDQPCDLTWQAAFREARLEVGPELPE